MAQVSPEPYVGQARIVLGLTMPSKRAAIAIRLLDHVAEMNTDPEFNAALGWEAGVAVDYFVLNLSRNAQRRQRCGI